MTTHSRLSGALLPARVPVAWVVVVALVALAPSLGLDAYWSRQVVMVCILSLVTSGLVLSFGFAGELSFGQTAIYAAGAYAGGAVAAHQVNDLAVVLLVSAIAGTVVGLVAGIPGLRLGGWMLAISSFFLVVLIPDVVQWFPESVLGSYTGLTGIPLPELFGTPLTSEQFYAATVLVTAAWFAMFRNLARSRYGSAMLVLKQSPVLASSLGMSVYRLKLQAYAVGAIPAGVAGGLFAYLDGFVAPESFTLNISLAVLAACIIGGATSVYGTLAGVALLQFGLMRASAFEDYATVAFGAFLILGGVVLSDGVAGLGNRLLERSGVRRRWAERFGQTAGEQPEQPVTVDGKNLRVEGVSKHFGGVYALRDVSFEARPGRITALIGPNGSGKTTLLNVISGLSQEDQGQVRLGDQDLTRLSAYQVARRGVARTFQTPAIPAGLTVDEVLTSARLTLTPVSMAGTALRLPKYHRTARADRAVATRVLAATGLTSRRQERASELALGTRRMLELARTLMREPSVILLDEVASGLDIDEVVELDALLQRLRDAGATVVLVEHNFSLVKAIADHVVVLAEGRVVVQGTPEEIERDPDVRKHYLGEHVELSGTSLNRGGTP